MGAAENPLPLLTTSISLQHPTSLRTVTSVYRLPYALICLRRHFTFSPSPPSHILGLHIRPSRSGFRSRSVYSEDSIVNLNAQRPPLQWPEWSRLIVGLTYCGYFDQQKYVAKDEDAFVPGISLPGDFVRAAYSCLAFAHDHPGFLRYLSKKDVDVIVHNGTPFMFKNEADSTQRMVSYLGREENNVLEYDAAHTVDLMKFLLSYVSNPAIFLERSHVCNKALFESSARVILIELTRGIQSVSEPNKIPTQISRPRFRNKLGDWICKRCNFYNFARNRKCMECERGLQRSRLIDEGWKCFLSWKNKEGSNPDENVLKQGNEKCFEVSSKNSDDDLSQLKKIIVPRFVPFPPNYFAKKSDDRTQRDC